jgi:chloramphenicol 3-O phosphotransferase
MTGAATSSTAPGRVVLFNGPPSSGKTSLVNALVDQRAEPCFHLSLDDFRMGIAERSWLDDDGTLFEGLITGYLGSLRAVALAGIDVMAEAVMVPARRSRYAEIFGELPVIVIGVRCPLDVATQRERDRTDRRGGPIDFPADYFGAVYSGLTYDYEIATDTGDPSGLAATVAANLDRLVATSFSSHLSLP